MNWEPLKRVLMRRPIFCVCDRSSAASTSSRMYMGAGLNCSSAMISESATSDLFVIIVSGVNDMIDKRQIAINQEETRRRAHEDLPLTTT